MYATANIVAAIVPESELKKFTNDVPIPISCGSSINWAAGVIDTERKLSAIPVNARATKYITIEVAGVVNPITNIGIPVNAVAATIAFHIFEVFLPTHVPAIIGIIIVSIVRGICKAPATLADLPIICIAPIGAYTFIAFW